MILCLAPAKISMPKQTYRNNKLYNNNKSVNRNVYDTQCYRIKRKEPWFDFNGSSGLQRRAFKEGQFPIWFSRICPLYENYEINSISVTLVSTYSALSTGALYVTFNSNPSQIAASSHEYMLQQQNAKYIPVKTRQTTMVIPKTAWMQQPTRRQCAGPDSYAFDIATEVAGTSEEGHIQVFLNYDITLYVPQINESLTTIKSSLITYFDENGNRAVAESGDFQGLSEGGALVLVRSAFNRALRIVLSGMEAALEGELARFDGLRLIKSGSDLLFQNSSQNDVTVSACDSSSCTVKTLNTGGTWQFPLTNFGSFTILLRNVASAALLVLNYIFIDSDKATASFFDY